MASFELDHDVLEAVCGGITMELRNAAADQAHARYAAAWGTWPRTELELAEIRKTKRFFKTLVDGHLREE